MDISPFIRVKNYESVLGILKGRLPYDAAVHNMAMLSPKYPNHVNIYAWDEETPGVTEFRPSSTWIITTSIREDLGRDIGISMPPGVKLTKTTQEIFSNSKIFGWDESHIFVALQPSLATMISEIDAHVKRNRITICPCFHYYCDPQDASKLDTMLKSGATMKSLTSKTGADFLHQNWRYATSGSLEYMSRIMDINPSSGIFVQTANGNEELVSGLVLPNNGLMGMLFTKKEHRSHSYGTLAMRSLMKEISAHGIIPCSTVDAYNEGSQLFHTKVGMKFSHYIDFVMYKKFEPQ